jgi:hypothetical protein
VSGEGDAGGGTVTFLIKFDEPQTGETVVIYGDPPLTQAVDYISGGTFQAETHEEALDKGTLQQTRTREMADRSLSLTEGSTDGSGQYDANGNRINSLGTPTATTDATTKTYVDALVNNTALGPAPTGLIATGSVTSRLLADRWGEIKNVMDFGAVGDGVANDTTAIQAAATAAAGSVLVFPEPSANYRITATIILPSNITVLGYGRPRIVQATAGGGVFAVTVLSYSNITISDLILEGPGSATIIDGSAEKGAIWIDGNGGTASDVRVTDCEVFGFYNGIAVMHTDRVWLERNNVHQFLLYGCLLSRSAEFHVKNNTIHECDQAGAAVSYGIMATGDNAGGNTTQRCSITGNIIYDIKSWDGIMSHDVSNLIIANNNITDVRMGIDVGCLISTNIVEKVLVTGNYIQATTTDTRGGVAGAHYGIQVAGFEQAPIQPIYDVSITNNILNNFNNMTGALYAGSNPAAISLRSCGDGLIANNVVSDLGNVVTSYGPLSVYAPQHNISITGNIVNGTFTTFPIRVQHADAGDTCGGLMVANNQNGASTAAQVVYIKTGTYTGVSVTNNGTVTTAKSVLLDAATVTYVNGDGSWTPGLSFGGGTTGITYGTQSGRFHIQNNKIWFSGTVILTDKGSSTGNALVTGLPVVTRAGASDKFPVEVWLQEVSFANSPLALVSSGGTSTTGLHEVTEAGTVSNLTNANFGNTSRVYVQGFYEID